MHLMERKHLPASAWFCDRVEGFCGISWRTERILTPGFPCNSRKEDWEEPRGAPCPAPCSAGTASPGRASQHRGTAGSAQIVHIPPLISRLQPLLLSAPQDLFSPPPSPALLMELLHGAQRKQRVGHRAIRGSKATWANVPSVKVMSFQLAKLLNRSNLLLPDRTAEAGVRCNDVFADSVRQQITKHRPQALVRLLQERRGGEPCQDLCVLSVLRGLRQKERQFQAADRGTESSLQSLWLHFTKVYVYRASSLPAKCKHDL